MNIIRIIRQEVVACLITLVSPIYVLLIICISIAAINLGSNTYMELLLNSFAGPLSINGHPIIAIIWFSHQICILYFVCNYFNIELKDRYIYTITRFKSKSKWLLTRIIHIAILIFVYYVFLFLSIFVIGKLLFGSDASIEGYAKEYLIYTGYISVSPGNIIINILILIILTTVVISIFQVIITLVSRNSILSITISQIVIILSISINLLDIKLDKYFPANQAIFFKHNFYDFSFRFSYIYLLFFLLILIYFSYYYIKKVEI